MSVELEAKRREMIAGKGTEMPKVHKANYDKAVSGRSKKAATKAFCLECVQWHKDEVRLCTSLACPLYPYRPYKESSKQASQVLSFLIETKKPGRKECG